MWIHELSGYINFFFHFYIENHQVKENLVTQIQKSKYITELSSFFIQVNKCSKNVLVFSFRLNRPTFLLRQDIIEYTEKGL